MKDIYELFNDLNIDFSHINEIEINELERKKGKKKLMNSIKKKTFNRKKSIVAASIILTCTVGGIIVKNPAWAINVPIIGDIIQKTFIDSNPEFENYINVVGKTSSYNGIDITFENAIADKNNLILSYVVKDNNKPIENYFDMLSPMIVKINGERVNTSGGADGEKIDDNTVRILQTINLNFEKIPKILNVEILDKKRNIYIKFSMDTKEIENSTKTQSVNKKVNIDGDEINIDKIDISPIISKVYYTIKPKEVTEENKYDMKYYFWAFDQDDKELKWGVGGSRRINSLGVSDCNDEYVSRKNINKLTFIPIKYEDREQPKVLESQKVNINNFEPISFKITDNIILTVESLERDGDKVTVKYNYYYKNNKLYRVDGENLFIKSSNAIEEFITPIDEIVDDECNTVVYNIPNENEIEIGCYDTLTNKILEDKAFSIDIK